MKKLLSISNKVLGGVAVCSFLFIAAGQPVSAENSPEKTKNPHEMMATGGVNPHQMGMSAAGSEAANPHEGGAFAAGDRKEVSWTLPEGWSELPPTSMRLGNFVYSHKNGQKVEITVASLPGPAGGVAANFGMWRSQLGLPHVDDAEVLKQSEKVKVGDLDLTMTDIVSEQNIVDSKYKARIEGAIYSRGPNTWFFKMKGEDSAVKESKDAFITFLKSLKFQDSNKG